MSIEETLDRLATNVAMIAGAISTLAEAVNGTYKGNPIYAQQQATGKKMTPEEISGYVDNAFRQNQVIPHWYGDSDPKPILSMQWTDVPSADQAAITKVAPNASNTDKLRLYWLGQQQKKQ